MGYWGRLWGAVTGRSLENPNYDLNDPAAWSALWGDLSTDTGLPMNQSKALEYAPVYQAVSMISGDIARLPLNCRKYLDEDRKANEVDDRHPAQRPVRYRANDEVSSFKHWRRFGVHALLWNNAYSWIDFDNAGRVAGLYNLLPDRTHAERVMTPQGPQLVYITEVTTPTGPRLQTLRKEEVLHVEGVGLDNLEGCDLTKKMRNVWALGLALEKFTSKFFKEGARVGGILEIPPTFTREAATNLEEGFLNKHTGPDNWFRVAILRDGAKFHSTTVAPQEGKLTEAGEDVVRQVARAFQLPPSKLGISDSVSYGSKAEDNQAYFDQTLSVWLTAIADECRLKLLSETEQQGNTHFFEHDTKRLLALDPLKRAQQHAIYIRNQVLSPNDVRAEIGYNPYDGGDDFRTPGAPSPQQTGGDNDGTQDNDGGADGSTPQETDNGNEDERHALTRCVYAIGQRARHKAKSPNAYIEWIDSGLKYHREELRRELPEFDVDAFVDPLAQGFRGLDKCGADSLAHYVDNTALAYERHYVDSFLGANNAD